VLIAGMFAITFPCGGAADQTLYVVAGAAFTLGKFSGEMES
jgi:hypothetical protein